MNAHQISISFADLCSRLTSKLIYLDYSVYVDYPKRDSDGVVTTNRSERMEKSILCGIYQALENPARYRNRTGKLEIRPGSMIFFKVKQVLIVDVTKERMFNARTCANSGFCFEVEKIIPRLIDGSPTGQYLLVLCSEEQILLDWDIIDVVEA